MHYTEQLTDKGKKINVYFSLISVIASLLFFYFFNHKTTYDMNLFAASFFKLFLIIAIYIVCKEMLKMITNFNFHYTVYTSKQDQNKYNTLNEYCTVFDEMKKTINNTFETKTIFLHSAYQQETGLVVEVRFHSSEFNSISAKSDDIKKHIKEIISQNANLIVNEIHFKTN